MAEVLHTQPHLGMDMAKGRDTSGPLPNPPFVFPMQSEIPSEASNHARTSSNADSAGSRRSVDRSRPQRISINKLPAFDFNPVVSSPVNRTPSPARSPTRRTPPIHHGHRRNNSEYVGGDVTNGGPVLVSASPTKSELPSGHGGSESGISGDGGTTGGPTALSTTSTGDEGSSHLLPGARLGPPTTRRGHAHRRSGAISSHDLSMILKPASEMKGGSAPTTPSDSMFQRPLPPALDRSVSQPEATTSTQESLGSAAEDEQSSHTGPPRSSRVGFSDVLEFIPRPLSTISSETSSSMSTVRASHSVSNSITSMIGGGNSSSPQSNMNSRSGRRSALEQDTSRVRPAGFSPPRDSQDWSWDFSGLDSPAKRPSSAPAGGSPSKGANVNSGSSAVETPRKAADEPFRTSIISPDKSYKNTSSPTLRATNLHAQRRRPLSPTMRPRTSPEPKVTKRQRKGRSWAGLLSRKGKHHDARADFVSRRSPTPPLRQHTPETEFSLDDITFDEDTTCIIETTSSNNLKLPRIQTNYAAWKPRETSPLSETDSSASMLDIDAALRSFDSPSTGPAFEDVISGGVSSSKRRMHSSGNTGGFAGPGMHYHRRAESAPEMEAIDHSKFGFPRFGSNPTMAIEEEEEEEDEEGEESMFKQTNGPTKSDEEELQDDQTTGLGVNIVEAESNTDPPMQRGTRRSSKRFAENANRATTPGSRLDAPNEFSLVEIVGADEEPRFSVVTKSSDESTITPTLSRDPLDARSVSAPLDFAMPTPALTYDGTPETPSAVSSPDFSRTSFDMPRMHTASSSITDRATLNSSRAGDHALTLHSSVDDVPSLTSSASTMASGHPPRMSSSANTCSSADRPDSFSAPVPTRTRPVSAGKRNSLASLTRLVGAGSYNRSKLNIEECVQPDPPEKTEKKKGNRISRLMKFWKSKEKLSSS